MTSWDLSSLLLLMLLNIDLSEQNCLDYLKPEEMLKNSPLHLVPLVKAKNDNSKNAVICTLKYECQKNETSRACSLLEDCIYCDSDDYDSSDTSECEGLSGLSISTYHLTCLTAEIFFSITKEEHIYEVCKYDSVCHLYSDITSQAQTTTRPPSSTASERAPTAPSALSPETTPTSPGTLMQKATTTAPCTLLTKATPTAPRTLRPKVTPTTPRTEQKTRTTTAPTALFPTTATATTTTTLFKEGDKAPTTGKRIAWTGCRTCASTTSLGARQRESNLLNLLLMSLTFNVLGPLLVYFYMRWRTRNQTPVDGPWEEAAHTVTDLEFQNMHSEAGPETVQLMQLRESASDITATADLAQDGFTERLSG